MRNYLPLLQVYRGIAACLVVGYHVSGHSKQWFKTDFLFDVFEFGNIGVDFFFLLSGFIIFYTNHHKFGHNREIGAYFVRRFIRVYPVFWIVLFLMLVTHLVLNNEETCPTAFESVVQSFFLYLGDAPLIVGVSWTLTYEVIFYIAFGLLLFFPRHLAISLIIGWALFNAATYAFDIFPGTILDTRPFVQFAIGTLLAVLVTTIKIPKSGIIIILATLVFLIPGMLNGTDAGHMSPALFWPMLFASSVMIVMGSPISDLSKVPANKLLCLVGDATYSIYLTHYIVLQVIYTLLISFDLLETLNPTIFNLLLFAVLVALGCLFYIVVERPTLNFLRRRSLRITGLSGASTDATAGEPVK